MNKGATKRFGRTAKGKLPFACHWCIGCGVVPVNYPNTYHNAQCAERAKRKEDTADVSHETSKEC